MKVSRKVNKNLARRGKASEQIAFRCLAIAIVLCIGGALLSSITNSVIAWILPVIAVPVAGGGVLAWHWSTKWHREFLKDAPWTEVETLITDAATTLADIEAGFFHRATPDELDSVLRALDGALRSQEDQVCVEELQKAVGGAKTLDQERRRKILFALVTIRDVYSTSRWQKERAVWDRVWRNA